MEFMDESIENIFECMVDRKVFEDAIDFIDSIVDRVPHRKTVNWIIFKMLMDEKCDWKAANAAGLYLIKVLAIYPPSDQNRRLYYKGCLECQNNSLFTLWATFCHLVESSLCHLKIYKVENEGDSQMRPLQDHNCEILMDFYLRVLTRNYEYISKERSFLEKKEKSLVCELFWPSQVDGFNASKENPRRFLGWIRSLYEHMSRVQKVSIIPNLHKLLVLMVKSIVISDISLDELTDLSNPPNNLICSTPSLINVVRVLLNTCPIIFQSHEGVRRFMNHVDLKYFRLKICEFVLHQQLFSKQPQDKNFSPTTLKDIVETYMFPKQQAKRGRKPKNHKAPEPQQKEKAFPVYSPPKWKSNMKRDTDIHEACRLDKPADLYEKLLPTTSGELIADVNAKNSVGYTPLHMACMSSSFLCAKVLIDECCLESNEYNLDFTAADEDGHTPLHLAVQKNSCDIAKLILKKGGDKVLTCIDNTGKKPQHYVRSPEMEKLMKEFLNVSATSETEESVKDIFTRNIPNMESFREYALFIHTLQFYLSYYADIYFLYRISNLTKNDSPVDVHRHETKTCPHFVKFVEKEVCSWDFEYLKHLPDIVNYFIKCVKKCAKEKHLKLDLELFPLEVFVACF